MKKNISLIRHSNDISSTKEYSNTFYNSNTPSSNFPNNITKIKKEKNKNRDEIQENVEFQKKVFQDNAPQSISDYSKQKKNKIIFNSAKSFSSKPKKYFSDYQKSTKMKIIELNSNSNSKSNKERSKYIYNSFHPSIYEPKITPRVNTLNNYNSSSKKKLSSIPMNRSFKKIFSNSQGFSAFSKSFHKKYKTNKKIALSHNSITLLNKSSSSIRKLKKNLKYFTRSNSYRNYNYYLNPTNRQYLGIDLNLVSNSSHRMNDEINSQKKRYIKNYNYNNDDEENDNNEDDIIDYNFKSNDKYFFPKNTENDEEKQEDNNEEYIMSENNIDENNNLKKSKSKENDKVNNDNIKKIENNEINLNINKDISEIKPNQKNDFLNKNKNNIKKYSLNQFINRPNLKKNDFNNSNFSNIRPISHFENTSINQINQSTPISSFQMYPYEAESSPTNYIKSTSNINNLTYLTINNNSKRHNKNNNNIINHITKDQSEGQSLHTIYKSKDDDDPQKSYSHLNLNQSEFTYNNTSNYKNSEKDEEKRLTEKLEFNHKLKSKNNIKINNENKENINSENYKINNNIHYCAHNTIEEKDEESEYLDKINSNLLSKDKDMNKNNINKNSDIIEQSQDSLFQESDLINETKKILNKKNKNKNNLDEIYTGKNDEKGDFQKKFDFEIKLNENEEDKEIMERLARLRKEKEKKEEMDMEEIKLRKKLEEEKIKNKNEEKRIKNLKFEEEEKILKKQEEEKIKELEKIKEEIKNEQKQRINLEKEAELLQSKIKNNNIDNINQNKNNDILLNDPYKIDNKSNKSNTTKNLYFDYILSTNKIENINDKLQTSGKKEIKIKSNNPEDISNNKDNLNNHIISTKYKKKYVTGGLKSSTYNYNFDYRANANIDNEIFNTHFKNINSINNVDDKIINNNDITNNYYKNIIHNNNDNNVENNDPEFNIINNDFEKLRKKKLLDRCHSQSQFQIEIISKENKKKSNDINNSFCSFSFKINSNTNKLNPNKKEIKKFLLNQINENSIEFNNNKDIDKKLIKNENSIISINKNNSINNSINNQKQDELINKTLKKEVYAQLQDYYISKDNNANNNNLFFRNYISGIEHDNTNKTELKSSLLNYSNSINKQNNDNKIINEKSKTININKNNGGSEYSNSKNDSLFEYEKFKNQYNKRNSNKKLNKSLSNIDKIFDIKKENNNYIYKKNGVDDNDDFYKKKKYNDINNISDNKKIMYNKIPHHMKNERNKEGIWADYSINSYNKTNNTIRISEQSSSFYSINNSNKIINKNKFNRKINTSVLPPNPFDTVNEAREYFFFND